uniref:Putative ABCG protein n=1 Tax=Chrysomela populi TaxID=154003 RepID=A0A0U9HYG1_CHRPP
MKAVSDGGTAQSGGYFGGTGDVGGDIVVSVVPAELKAETVMLDDNENNLDNSIGNRVDMQFENITYTAIQKSLLSKTTKKEILHSINGRFPPGQLIAIMGPSGAGKSTLLDVLSGYRINGVGGTVYANGRPRDVEQFRRSSCYITQDDRLQPLFSVLESMRIAADLKLQVDVGRKKKEAIINNILEILGLQKTKNVRASQLSGGQKKRLSIALELISNPMVMFLDEPTTGLDSSSCTMCIKLLKQLASEGRTIVCTIHQPSAMLFSFFDQVYVLAAGNCVYQGGTEKMVPFFQAIGYPCPMYHNPADYVIELACGEYGEEKVVKMIQATSNGKSYSYFNDPNISNTHVLQDISSSKKKENSGNLLATSQFNQLKVLLRRGFVKAGRDQTLTYLRVGVNIAVSIMLGTLYWKAGDDGTKVLDNYNLLFSILMHHTFATMMLTILTIPQEISILTKEHFNRWYSLKMYYTSITIVDIPLSIVCCFTFTAIVYFMTGQPPEMVRFMMFFISSQLVVLVVQGLGLMIGAYFNVTNGTFLGPTLCVPMMMFAGFGVRLCDLPPYLYWGSYVSYLRYALEGVVGAIYGLDRAVIHCPEDAYCHYKYPRTFLETVGVRSDQFENDIIALLLFVFVLRMTAYVVLRLKLMAIR